MRPAFFLRERNLAPKLSGMSLTLQEEVDEENLPFASNFGSANDFRAAVWVIDDVGFDFEESSIPYSPEWAGFSVRRCTCIGNVFP